MYNQGNYFPMQQPQQQQGWQQGQGYPQQQQQQPYGQPAYGQQQPYGQPQQYPNGYQQQQPQQVNYNYPQMDTSQQANQVIARLKYAIDYHKIDMAELFCKYDRSADSTLNPQEFGDLLKVIDPNVQAYEIYAAFSKFDENKRGVITFGDFCKNLGRYTEACNQVYDPNQLKKNNYNSEQAIEKLKMAVTYYRIDLKELFSKYDSSRNYNLNLHEFGQLLKRMEPNITNYEIDLAFNKFDTDRSGTITFEEFSRQLYQSVVPNQQYPQQPYGGYPQQQYGGYPQQQQQYPQQQQQMYPPQQVGYPPQQYGYPPQQQGYNNMGYSQGQPNYGYPRR